MKKAAALVLITILALASLPAQAQPPAGNFGIYLTGRERAAEFLKVLTFRDLPDEGEAGPVLRLAAQGVLKGDGSGNFYPQGIVSRQEALVALVRLLGWEQEALAAAGGGFSGAAETGLASWAQGYVAAAAAGGLIGQAEASTAAGSQTPWDVAVTREEVAAWAVRALELVNPAALPASPGLLDTYPDAEKVKPELKPLLAQAVALGLLPRFVPVDPPAVPAGAGLGAGTASAVPGQAAQGVFSDSEGLVPQGYLTRAGLAYLLDRLAELLPPAATAAWQLGTLTGRLQEVEEEGGRPVTSTLWEITGPGGSAAALKLTATHAGDPVKDVVVLRDGKLHLGVGLRVGDSIRYLVTGNGVVPFIEVLPGQVRMLQGSLEVLDPNGRLVLLAEDGSRYNLALTAQAAVFIDGQPATARDLVPGQEVSVKALGNAVWEVTAHLADAPFPATPPAKVVSGKVRFRDDKSLTLVLPSGQVVEYEVTAGTQVLAGGRAADLQAVRPGDQVRVHLPDPNAQWVERIEVAGRAGRVAALYRGRLGTFSPRSGEIVLNEPKRLEGGTWQPSAEATLHFPLSSDATVWAGDRRLDLGAAAALAGADVYVAVGTAFGRPEALQVLVTRAPERSYEGRVKQVNPALGTVRLTTGELALSRGAIVLKEGRLADAYALAEGDSVQALVQKEGGGSVGLVVNVLGGPEVTAADCTLYKGRVAAVGQDAWQLKYYYTWAGNEWDYHGRKAGTELGLTRDTVILELLGEAPKLLTTAEFRQGYYRDLYDDATALAVVTEDDETLALALWSEDALGAERLTAGCVDSIEEKSSGPVLSLSSARDFSQATKQWQNTFSPQELKLDGAVVIKDGRAATWQALAGGDEVEVLRQGETALVVFVKE